MSNLNENDIAKWKEQFATEEKEYRKKPVIVTAYQTDKEMNIETLEGTMKANIGDYIITGVKGEKYPCKPDVFNETYVAIDEMDTSIEEFVLDNCIEWSNLITELNHKEAQLLELKDIIFDKEQWIIENTDFKAVYGKNNADVRKLHFNKHMKGEYDNRKELELSIDYCKRRISYLKGLVTVKTALLEAKTHD